MLCRRENDFNTLRRCDPGECNIKLTMTKAWCTHIKAYIPHRLTLCLVYGHSESQGNRKLAALEDKVQLSQVRWSEGHSWDESNFAMMKASKDTGLDDPPSQMLNTEMCSIAKSIFD